MNKVLPTVAKALFKGMLVTYADVHQWGDTRKQFGIDHKLLPAITFYQPTGGYVPYPADNESFEATLEAEEIIDFGTKVIKGEIESV